MISYPPELREAFILNQNQFVWEAPAFERYERGPRWYVAMAVVALLLMAYAIWTANFLFALFILLMAILLILTGNEQPNTVLIQIGENALVWNGRIHLYQDLDTFAIVYEPPLTKILYIEHRSSLLPRLRIPLEEQNPVEIREHLKQYLHEDLDLQTQHISDNLARLLRI